MKAEPSLGSDDDTATNGIAVKCRGPGLFGTDLKTVVEGGQTFADSAWGSWSEKTCPAGMIVCSSYISSNMIPCQYRVGLE